MVYLDLLKMLIFHGKLLNNQMVAIVKRVLYNLTSLEGASL